MEIIYPKHDYVEVQAEYLRYGAASSKSALNIFSTKKDIALAQDAIGALLPAYIVTAEMKKALQDNSETSFSFEVEREYNDQTKLVHNGQLIVRIHSGELTKVYRVDKGKFSLTKENTCVDFSVLDSLLAKIEEDCPVAE